MMGALKLLSALFLLSLLPPGLSHVVNKFSDIPECEKFILDGKTPNIPGILVDGNVQDQNRYKPICQHFKGSYRFATLYDTTNRIPVFSAYTYKGTDGGTRPKNEPWKIEPQLDNINNPEMIVSNSQQLKNQAVDPDYEKNQLGLDRGHLLPCFYGPNLDAKRSTFTLTNAVPQACSFNRVNWRKMECRVRKILEKNCIDANRKINAYLVTGAVPGSNKMKNKVNIPSFMWTAFCCYNSIKKVWISQGYWGKNEQNANPSLITLKKLEDDLATGYNTNANPVKVFPDQCLRNVITNKRKRRLVEMVEGEKDRKRPRTEMDDCGDWDECDCDDM